MAIKMESSDLAKQVRSSKFRLETSAGTYTAQTYFDSVVIAEDDTVIGDIKFIDDTILDLSGNDYRQGYVLFCPLQSIELISGKIQIYYTI